MGIELTKNMKNNGFKTIEETQTKHRKAKKGHGWTKLERIEMDCNLGKFEKNTAHVFFKIFSNLCQFISKYHLHSGKIILSCYVALILLIKDPSSANLTLRAHN